MELAIEKAQSFGIGAVGVRNSNHYGAAGVYALQAAAKGFIGLSMTAVYAPSIVPTFGREPRMGTNPDRARGARAAQQAVSARHGDEHDCHRQAQARFSAKAGRFPRGGRWIAKAGRSMIRNRHSPTG